MIETKDWTKICADCKEGYPPEDCEYYGEPRGCNAPTYGGPPPRYYEELREENARLRAALKPVLEVYISQDDNSVSVYDGRLDAAFALNAVREAKRIYNDGEERIASPSNCDRP